MVENNKRKKHHDKDKYYRLAKEQGYRSRAAFKLTQINRKFNVLQNAKTIIDLCAAPGGWTQVCARSLPNNSSTTILAVDILPIRSMGSKNVITLIGDITTEKCKAAIRSEMQGVGADVVLCDGAPNVGASYDKDAYEQNEIALHSLKCATEHLRKNGKFVTKLYRSTDYSAYLWVAKQFFRNVQAVKPSASRKQSAEIFLVCEGYIAPDKIDHRMFDPKFVFAQVDGQATGGGDKSQTGEKAANVNIFHKDFGRKMRSRNGYDLTNLDASMRRIGTVAGFLEGGSTNDPIQMLSDCTGLAFLCGVCKDAPTATSEDEKPKCNCSFYLNHRLTTPEVRACLSDLKVLNKGDFTGLLKWRDKIRAERRAASSATADAAESDADSDDNDREVDSDAEDEQIQSEIEELRKKTMREKKRKKKKEREVAAKLRKRAAFGMDLNAIDVPDNDKIFSLATITNAGDLEAAREIDLENVTTDQVTHGGDDSDDDEDGLQVKDDGSSSDEDENKYGLEEELDAAYNRYLSNTNDGMAKSGTKMAKRTKKLEKQKALEQAREDAEMVLEKNEDASPGGDARRYAQLLQGNVSDASSDEDDYDSDADGNVVRDGSDKYQKKTSKKATKKAKTDDSDDDDSASSGDEEMAEQNAKEPSNPLIFKLADEPVSVKTSRWFSNPLFESIENSARSASFAADKADENNVFELDSDDEKPAKKRTKTNSSRKDENSSDDEPMGADDIIASMPKTDKQKRHEKRMKSIERMDRRNARREREAGMTGVEVVAPVSDDDNDTPGGKSKKKFMTDAQREKHAKAKELIKAGMGSGSTGQGGKDSSAFEVVPVVDTRKYDSENEDYDSDDHVKTLALGTMILRKSKEKAMVDASYNRFAWNDPQGLPDWFVDDENKNYRPQLPIPPALLEKMNAKILHLAAKPIAKVAEARARKSKMAKNKLAAAKKKAESVANSSEMSETMKLKAISKAMRGKEASRPGKTYVVSQKGGGSKGGKGIKLVDKREKSDKRATERITKKKKHGKKGGMTGSKRRRNHK